MTTFRPLGAVVAEITNDLAYRTNQSGRRIFSLIEEFKQLYKPLADRARSYGVYSSGNGNFRVLAVDDGGGFIIADNIPSFGMAELIAESLNLVARVAGNDDA
jgi:hypothetical protein